MTSWSTDSSSSGSGLWMNRYLGQSFILTQTNTGVSKILLGFLGTKGMPTEDLMVRPLNSNASSGISSFLVELLKVMLNIC